MDLLPCIINPLALLIYVKSEIRYEIKNDKITKTKQKTDGPGTKTYMKTFEQKRIPKHKSTQL
jgi:hypothetical protein